MKRIRIWLKDLTLFQQFFAISFLIFANFLALFLFLLNYQIDSFINDQMFRYLHQSRNNYITAHASNYDFYDPNANHFIYSLTENNNSYFEDKIIQSVHLDDINFENNANIDQKTIIDGKNIIFSISTTENEGELIISVIASSYYNNFRQTLINNVANLNIIMIVSIFAFCLLWVAYLTSPLKKIKQYILKIKQEKEAELNIDRRDEIGEVASALVDMQNELSKQNKIKQEMIQNISHDLKTPIATIKSYGEAIKDGVYPYETLEKSVDVIIEHAERLENKVYNLITFNKLGYLKDELSLDQTVEMSEIINRVILGLKVLRPEIEIKLNIEKSSFIGDEESWRILVENLIDNALRHAKNEVVIELKENYFSVYNDGDSITSDTINRLFKPYEKGSGGRFGLGLSIAKRVCDAYGYNIRGENVNAGVLFKVYRIEEKRKKKTKKDEQR